MKIRSKLTLMFLALSVITVIVGLMGVFFVYISVFEGADRRYFFTAVAALGLVTLVGLGLSIVFAAHLMRLVLNPVRDIANVARQAGETGNFRFGEDLVGRIHAQAQYNDELGVLAAAFEKMMDDIIAKVHTLEVIATGDLTVRAILAGAEDTLGNAINAVANNLNEMVTEIRSGTSQLSAGANQLSSGAQTLAQSAAEQSAAVEELLATVGGIAGQAEENALRSKRATELAGNIRDSAEEGRGQMIRMTHAMDDINSASQSISSVMKAIDDIAFQTNILSLNAAVEAARAGQHGKGFAVVADEVRNLATKSAAAAKDSNDLIVNTLSKSKLGSVIVKDTSDYLDTIVNGVNDSTSVVNEIAQATEEQSVAIDQINKGITQLTNAVYQNSATAQESAAASDEMSAQATALMKMVDRFIVNEERPVAAIARNTVSHWGDAPVERAEESPSEPLYSDERGVSPADLGETRTDVADFRAGIPEVSNAENGFRMRTFDERSDGRFSEDDESKY
ncbi:MAG: methyl-accepting chemotaxis protein [Clostridiales Family XIII bacterium]|jgi:methyl-accepting chemotaxis protein|nr:methyl-accepting chemotaxis protein [Clostridiales Family XIII bacterium]